MAKAAADMPSAAKLAAYSRSLVAFADDMPIRTARGLERFGTVKADAQHELLAAVAPAATAALAGRQVKIRRFWVEMTKGWAKSWMIAAEVLWMLALSRRALRIQIAAADRDQAGIVRAAAINITQAVPWLTGRIRVDKFQIVCAKTDSVAEIIAADVAGSHGALPDALFVDEVTHVQQEDFVLNLLDNAEKVPHGLVVLSMNAGQIDSWQYRLRDAVLSQPERWWFKQVLGPAPYHDPAGIEDARRRSSASRFNRLFGGIWSAGGDALDSADVEAAIVLDGPTEWADPRLGYVAGLDLGVKQDHSAFVVLAVDGRQDLMKLADCRSWAPPAGGEVDLLDVKATIEAAAHRFPGLAIGFDPHQCSFLAQQLRRDGIRMIEVPFVGKSLDVMASALLQAFRSRTIQLYREPKLIADLSRLQIEEKSYGYRLTAPSDKVLGHADRAIALSIAIPIAAEAMQGGGRTLVIDGFALGGSPFSPRMTQRDRFGGGPSYGIESY